MNNEELILVLKEQHLNLKKDFVDIINSVGLNDENEINSIILSINKFKKDLLDHLKLEDEEFYPAYFKKAQNNKEYVQELMSQMDQIIKVVMAFFKKYENQTEIINNKNNFRDELLEIINTLNVRTETEEEGIYSLYLA